MLRGIGKSVVSIQLLCDLIQKGCYIYCEDKELSKYIKRMLGVK